jgi:enamine deaminase RidA (YjgF/YER057c/UK114 family)
MNMVWCQWIDPNNKPVRATTEASLAASDMLVEIQLTAAKKWTK